MTAKAIDVGVSSEAWLRLTLDEILGRIRDLLDLRACAFQVVDWDHRQIHAAAAWFTDDHTHDALAHVLDRPYEPERAGVTEAAIEQGTPLLIRSIDEWSGA